jgi:hypothetical protein
MMNLQTCSKDGSVSDEHLVSKAKKFKETFMEQIGVTGEVVAPKVIRF